MADTSLVMVGLAILPFSFFYFALNLPPNIQAFRILFNAFGFIGIAIFFNQAVTSIPEMVDAFSWLYFGSLILLVFYIMLEFFQLFKYLMDSMMQTKPR